MQKTPYLSSSILLSQIQSRLAKNPYLSRQDCPCSADAQVFLAIQKIKKIPNRQSHPYLYHWFIIMKQFAHRTLQIWIKRAEDSSKQDQLIDEFIFQTSQNFQGVSLKKIKNQQISDRLLKCLQLNKQNIQKKTGNCKKLERRRTSIGYAQLHLNTTSALRKDQILNQYNSTKQCQKMNSNGFYSFKNEVFTPISKNQHIIQMELIIQSNLSLECLKAKLAKQQLQIIAFQIQDGIMVQIVALVQAIQYDKLKNRLSKWPQIVNICFRKEKKKSQYQIRSQKCLYSPTKVEQGQQHLFI